MKRLLLILTLASGLTGLNVGCTSSTPAIFTAASLDSSSLVGQLILPYPLAATTTAGRLSQGEMSRLQARLDGQPLPIEIRQTRIEAEQTTLTYRITRLPEIRTARAGSVEILTSDGRPLLGGVVRFLPGRPFVYDFDVRSTSVLLKVRQQGLDARQMSLADLRQLDFDPDIIVEMAALRTQLRQDGALTPAMIVLEADGNDTEAVSRP